MADAYTGTGSVSWDQAAWNRLLYFAFREDNIFDQVADVKPTAQTNPGAAVNFFLANDLAPVSTALNESVDVDAVALTDSNVTVNLVEEGNAVVSTQLLRLTSMIATDPSIANLLGFNAAQSMDLIARDVLKVGTNVGYAAPNTGGARAAGRSTMGPAHTLSSTDVRYARNRLRRANVPKINGLYNALVHPDVIHDLQQETGGLGWTAAHESGDGSASNLWTGEIGVFQGFRFLDTTNAPIFANTGSGPATTDIYRSIFCGAQALAKAYSNAEGYGPMPITVKGPVVDKLERFQPWGWKHFVGYKIFRQAALYAIESASSIGDNAV